MLVGLLCLGLPRLLPAADAVVSSEFIYEKAPFPSCHASTMAETPDALVASWFGGTHERHPDVEIWVARRTAEGWSDPVSVADGVVDDQRHPTWNPVLYQAEGGGPLVLFYKVGPTPRDWWGMRTVSHDAGRTWSTPERLPDGILGPVKNKPVLLSTGELLCPTSTEGEGWRVHMEFTKDLGDTWSKTPPLNDAEEIRAIQPSVLTHGAGVLQAIGRTRYSGVFQVWSQDNGKTWGPMTTIGLPNPSSGTDAVTLHDGRHLLVYNHNTREVDGVQRVNKGRSPLNLAISDDGRRWDAVLALEAEDENHAGYSYPAIIQTADGLVHITYTWRRERIKHVVVDPSKLEGRPIEDGLWPDLPGGPR